MAVLKEELSALSVLLKPAHRRRVIWYLTALTQGQQVSVRELATQIGVVEQDVSPTTLSNPAYRRVYANLDQLHLPTLADADVLNYDSSQQQVTPGLNRDALALMIESANPSRHYW